MFNKLNIILLILALAAPLTVYGNPRGAELTDVIFTKAPGRNPADTQKLKELLDNPNQDTKKVIKEGYALAAALFRGNLYSTKTLIEYGADVNKEININPEDEETATLLGYGLFHVLSIRTQHEPIFFAIHHNGPYSTELLELLLKSGANPNVTDHLGAKPLSYAKTTNQAKTLLNHGAKFDKSDITKAAIESQHELLKLFLDKGADKNYAIEAILNNINKQKTDFQYSSINEKNSTGQTPLLFLLSSHPAPSSATIKTLLNLGADPNIEDNSGMTPLALASNNNMNEIKDILLSKVTPDKANDKDKKGYTALMHMAFKNNTEKVKELVNGGADVTLTNNRGQDALTLTSYHCNPEITRLLIEKGANANNVSHFYESALISATYARCIDNIELLLNAGANIETRNIKGETPLMISIFINDKKITEALLKHGADINISDKEGQHILLKTFEARQFDLAKLLIEHGADKASLSAFDPKKVTSVVETFNLEALKILIEEGVDINTHNNDGNTPLITAIEKKMNISAELLIESGADTNKSNNNYDKTTPLLAAINTESKEILIKLLENGADPNLKTAYSPLNVAFGVGNAPIIKILIDSGSKLHSIDEERSALYSATGSGSIESLNIALSIIKNQEAIPHKNGLLKVAINTKNTDVMDRIIELKLWDSLGTGGDSLDILIAAITTNDISIIDKVLAIGVDVNATNSYGSTALMFTAGYDMYADCFEAEGEEEPCEGPYIDIKKISEYLIKKGANKKSKNSNGETAYDLARRGYEFETEYNEDGTAKSESAILDLLNPKMKN